MGTAIGTPRRSTRHSTATLIATTVVAVLVSWVGPAIASQEVTIVRLGGATRYETAAAISRESFPESRYDAWLARGDLFPDALAASYPAANYNDGGPVLLTPPNELHPATRRELQRLGVDRVWIVGGEVAISAEVEADLNELGLSTRRVAGVDRFETARRLVATAPDGHFGVALLATGADFADALAAGPLAYAEYMPMFLTTGDRLHPSARTGLSERGIREVIIVGGTTALSEQVRRDVESICTHTEDNMCITTRRIGGKNRMETAAMLADELVRLQRITEPDWMPTHVNLARGDLFPDAAAGGPHGGDEVAPILLTAGPDALGVATKQWLEKHAPTIESIHVFGTKDAVSDKVVEEARQAATAP